MLDEFTSSDVDVFYGGWNLGARATGKRLGRHEPEMAA